MMQKCSYCGAELPENARFCGKCGGVQDATTTEQATMRSNTSTPYWTPEDGTLPASQGSYPYPVQEAYPAPGSQPSWSPTDGSQGTPTSPTEHDDERRGIAAWPAQYGVGLGAEGMISGGQPYNYSAPVVHGTPQIGGVPNVVGSPTPYANPLAGQMAQGPAYQSPVTHYSPAGQEANSYPPQQGTLEQRPGYEAEKHPEHHEHHARHAKHLHHKASSASKAAGVSGLKTIIIVITTIVVVAAGGVAAAGYFLNRPQPVISATSSYRVGNTIAGAVGSVLHISGQKFSSNSAITFLLDSNPAPGNPSAQSDSNGNFSANVPVTSGWSTGPHILTARDAGNNHTKNSVNVIIVQPGSANTPGPNGAPPDDATFTISLSAKGTYVLGNQPFNNTETLNITGHPDPKGGTVCQDADNGQSITTHSVTLDTHTPFTETYSLTCQGSYKSGKVTYTETLVTDVITYTTAGSSCTLASPQVNQQITGSFTSQHSFTGTLVYGRVPQSDFHCTNPNSYFYYSGGHGTWTGTVGKL